MAIDIPQAIDNCKDASSVATKRKLIAGSVDSRWLFNHLYVGVLLIDARPRDRFLQNTILEAISIPPPNAKCHTFDDISRVLPSDQAHTLTATRRKLRDIIVFGDVEDVANKRSWMYYLTQLLIDEALVMSVKTLTGGFGIFNKRYPFYTTVGAQTAGGLLEDGYRVTYPNEVVPNFLYLGNMWQAKSKTVIEQLGITHVVNASLDVGNVFADNHVLYHEVKLKDTPEGNIGQFFDSTFDFINRARHTRRPTTCRDEVGAPCRVLVHCTQGISRSATLVIMYLMRAHHWSLVEAFNHTRASRGVIIPNEGFLLELMREERRLYDNQNSLTEDELDVLVRGKLPDRAAPGNHTGVGCNSISVYNPDRNCAFM